MSKFKFLIIFLYVLKCHGKPNVVIIMADDMGSYDASFRGSDQILTPNIDALAYNGVILDRFYTPAMCTPSRSSLLTGKNPYTIGMQTWVIPAGEAWGLGLDQKLMSNYFHDAGYSTHLIGKWHLGFFQEKYTPNYRGFDSFYGYYNGLIDYYNYTYIEPGNKNFAPGYDFHKNLDVNWNVQPGSYATDLFTDEAVQIIKDKKAGKPLFLMINHIAPHTGNDYALLQAPQDEIAKFTNIIDLNRRTLAAMISKLDESVGKVIEALKERNILDQSIILFYSDNGAPTTGLFNNYGSNYPLKGQKNSPWEGANRNLGLIWSPMIKEKQRVYDGYFHTSDILPTLATACGVKIGAVDGFDQWKALVNGGKSPRSEIVSSLDPGFNYAGIISGAWKIVNGTVAAGVYDRYLGDIQQIVVPSDVYAQTVLTSKVGNIMAQRWEWESIFRFNKPKLTPQKIKDLRTKSTITCNEADNPIIPCNPLQAACLFNIIDDPCERKNLAAIYPATLEKLRSRMMNLTLIAAPVRRTYFFDPAANPTLHNNTWTWWVA